MHSSEQEIGYRNLLQLFHIQCLNFLLSFIKFCLLCRFLSVLETLFSYQGPSEQCRKLDVRFFGRVSTVKRSILNQQENKQHFTHQSVQRYLKQSVWRQ